MQKRNARSRCTKTQWVWCSKLSPQDPGGGAGTPACWPGGSQPAGFPSLRRLCCATGRPNLPHRQNRGCGSCRWEAARSRSRLSAVFGCQDDGAACAAAPRALLCGGSIAIPCSGHRLRGSAAGRQGQHPSPERRRNQHHRRNVCPSSRCHADLSGGETAGSSSCRPSQASHPRRPGSTLPRRNRSCGPPPPGSGRADRHPGRADFRSGRAERTTGRRWC